MLVFAQMSSLFCVKAKVAMAKTNIALAALAERRLLAIFTSACYAFIIFSFDQIMLLSIIAYMVQNMCFSKLGGL